MRLALALNQFLFPLYFCKAIIFSRNFSNAVNATEVYDYFNYLATINSDEDYEMVDVSTVPSTPTGFSFLWISHYFLKEIMRCTEMDDSVVINISGLNFNVVEIECQDNQITNRITMQTLLNRSDMAASVYLYILLVTFITKEMLV
ncbi:hypothetical protein ACOME3_006880 [Neoechinorhynchus agilis]